MILCHNLFLAISKPKENYYFLYTEFFFNMAYGQAVVEISCGCSRGYIYQPIIFKIGLSLGCVEDRKPIVFEDSTKSKMATRWPFEPWMC